MILKLILIILILIPTCIVMLWLLDKLLNRCPACGNRNDFDIVIEKIEYKGLKLDAEFKVCRNCGYKFFNRTV